MISTILNKKSQARVYTAGIVTYTHTPTDHCGIFCEMINIESEV